MTTLTDPVAVVAADLAADIADGMADAPPGGFSAQYARARITGIRDLALRLAPHAADELTVLTAIKAQIGASRADPGRRDAVMGTATDEALKLAREIVAKEWPTDGPFSDDIRRWLRGQIFGVWRLAMRLDPAAADPAYAQFDDLIGSWEALQLPQQAAP